MMSEGELWWVKSPHHPSIRKPGPSKMCICDECVFVFISLYVNPLLCICARAPVYDHWTLRDFTITSKWQRLFCHASGVFTRVNASLRRISGNSCEPYLKHGYVKFWAQRFRELKKEHTALVCVPDIKIDNVNDGDGSCWRGNKNFVPGRVDGPNKLLFGTSIPS